MKKVLLFTGPEQNCGIYQYAASLAEVYNSASKKYVIELVPTNDKNYAKQKILEIMPHAVIYNWHPWTLSWLDSGFSRPLKNELNIRQIMFMGHESYQQFVGIDEYILTDPTMISQLSNVHTGIPPVMHVQGVEYSKPNNILRIGTSGISNRTKNIERIIQLINEQFTEDVILNLHLIDGKYVDPTGKMTHDFYEMCRNLAKTNVTINLTREFFTSDNLVRWLNKNDINLYIYSSNTQLGVSASIDKALAAKKPIGVNRDKLLSHVCRDYNDIDRTSIKEIVERGIEPLQEFYDAWNPEKLVEKYENIIDASR